MKYLFVKMLRDLKNMWVQFFSVFMMAVLAITIYSGMEGVWFGLQEVVEDYYDSTNLADVWVYGSVISEENVEQISELDGVESYSESMTVTVALKDDASDKPDIKVLTVKDDTEFTAYTCDGKEFNGNLEGGIWLDESFADARDINVGDTITLDNGYNATDFTVEGLLLHSEFIYYTGSVTDTVPNHGLHGYAYISETSAEKFYGSIMYNEMRLNVSGECNTDRMQDEVLEILGDNYYDYVIRDDLTSTSQITKEIKQMKNMGNLFSFVFILLAVLSMYTTMTRLVNTQMTQIGIFKAIGISDGKIRLHYVLYALTITAFGGLVGSFLGPNLVSRAVMRVKKTTLTLPQWEVKLSYFTYLLIFIIIVICIFAVLFASRDGLKQLPAKTMRKEAPKTRKMSVSTKESFISKRLSFDWRWILRDISRNKLRWVLGIIGVAGSMMLMMAGLGFKDSIQYSNDYVYYNQYSYKSKATIKGYSAKELDELQEELDGKYQYVYENNAEFVSEDETMRSTVIVVDKGDYIKYEDLDGEEVSLPESGALISRKTADTLSVDVGDTIEVRVTGDSEFITIEIKDIIIAPSPQAIFMSVDYWEELGNEFFATGVLIGNTDIKFMNDLDYVKEIISIDNQYKSMEKMTKSVMTIIYLLIAASICLSVIILYNLGMLNFLERYREYATMKVLGFYQKEIRSLVLKDSILTTLIGWGIGIPIGYKFLEAYIGIVQFKTFEWIPQLSTKNFIISSVGVILCSMFVNLFIVHKVEKIDMIEALKSVE